MSFLTEPKIEDRKAQPYMGIRTRVALQELDVVIPQGIGEVFAFLGKQGVAQVHAPFVRYHVINMPQMLILRWAFQWRAPCQMRAASMGAFFRRVAMHR